MASRRAAAAVIGQLLQSHLQSVRQEEENQQVLARQQALARDASAQKLVDKMLSDREFALRLQNGGISQVGGIPTGPFAASQGDLAAPIEASIDKADTLGKLPTSEQIRANWDLNPDLKRQPNVGPPPPELASLMEARSAKEAQLRATLPPVPVNDVDPATGLKRTEFAPADPALLAGRTFQTEPTPQQAGANAGAQAVAAQPGVTASKVAEVNALAGPQASAAAQRKTAEEKASLPFEITLAQTRANTRLAEQQAMDDYRRKHPHATQQELNRASAAQTALGSIQEVRAMVDNLDKAGLMGPLAGRAADIAAGKIRAEELFKDPAQARLVADYFSTVGLLRSLATVAHGGSRGGGSPLMDKIFHNIISGTGDASIVSGQLDALERFMHKYADNPVVPADDVIPPDLNIPGMNSTNPNSPREILRQRLANRGGNR